MFGILLFLASTNTLSYFHDLNKFCRISCTNTTIRKWIKTLLIMFDRFFSNGQTTGCSTQQTRHLTKPQDVPTVSSCKYDIFHSYKKQHRGI